MGFRLDGVYEPPASRFAGPLLISPWRGGGGQVASQNGGMAFFLIFAPANRFQTLSVSVSRPADTVTTGSPDLASASHKTMARRTQVTVPYHTWRPDRGSPVPRHRPRIHTGRGSEFCQTHATHVEFRVWLNEDNCQRT